RARMRSRSERIVVMNMWFNPSGRSQTNCVRWLPEIGAQFLASFKRVARDLDLIRRARSEGAENRPGKEDREFDAAQRDIGTAVVEGVNLLRQFLLDQLRGAKEQIQARFPGRTDPQIALIDARAAVKEAKHLHGEELINLSLEEHRKRRQLKKF